MRQSARAALVLAFACVFDPAPALADAAFRSNGAITLAACGPSAKGYEMRPLAACRNRVVCVERDVGCKFADTDHYVGELKGDSGRLNEASRSHWAQASLKSIVCLPKDGKCPDDRNVCASQPAKDIGCGWRDVDAQPGFRRPAGDLEEAVVMSGVVKADDDETVTVLTQGRTVTVPKSTVRTPEYTMGQEVFYEVTSRRLVDFFFKKTAATARKRGTSSEPGKARRPPNSRRGPGPDSEPITFDEE